MKNPAAKGRRNEWRSKAILEARGMRCLRAAGSKGVFDLVCVDEQGIVFAQIKSSRWPSPSEMLQIYSFSVPSNASKEIHRWRPRARVPDIRCIPSKAK